VFWSRIYKHGILCRSYQEYLLSIIHFEELWLSRQFTFERHYLSDRLCTEIELKYLVYFTEEQRVLGTIVFELVLHADPREERYLLEQNSVVKFEFIQSSGK